jgi:hypothetical protein
MSSWWNPHFFTTLFSVLTAGPNPRRPAGGTNLCNVASAFAAAGDIWDKSGAEIG